MRSAYSAQEVAVSSQNKIIVRRIFDEVISGGDIALAEQLIADDFVNHDGRPPPGRDGFKQGLMAIRAAFPDWRSSIDDMVAEGDKIAARWTVTGTQRGPYMGLPPTGRQIVMREAGFLRIEGGKLVEIWRVADELTMLRELGALPPIGPPPPRSDRPCEGP
jgi:steroid delta-isomerase-like uncharacterized protein